MRHGSWQLWSVALLGLLVAAVFGRLVLDPGGLLVNPTQPSIDEHVRPSERTVGNDLTRLLLPHHQRIAAAVARTGQVPSWDPAGFGGRPLVGNPQAGLWYPPARLSWYLSSPAALGWITLAHLVLAGAGALVLARLQGLERLPSLVGAGAFAVSPQLLGHVGEGHYPHVWAVAWYPWAFAAVLLWRRHGGRSGWLAVAPLSLAMLTGHPQEGFYLVIALGLWVLLDAIRDWRGGEARRAITRASTWGLALGLILGATAVDWLPVVSIQGWTLSRTDLSLREASRYHVGLLNLLQIVSPHALGGPAEYVGRDNYWETQLGVGWLVFCLALVAARWGRERIAVKGWLVLALVSLSFATGHRLGVFTLFYEIVPGLNRFRVPARALFLTSLAATQLAAHGLDVLRRLDSAAWTRLSGRYLRAALGVAGLVCAGGGFAWLAGSTGETGPDDLDRLVQSCGLLAAHPVFWAALAGAGLLFLWSRGREGGQRGSVVLALGLLALLELGVDGFLLVRVARPETMLGEDTVAQHIRRHATSWPVRLRARDDFYGDWNAVAAGLEKTNLNDYFQLQHAADLYEHLYALFYEPRAIPPRLAFLQKAVGPGVPGAVLDRMSVEFLVTDRPLPAHDLEGLALESTVPWQGRRAWIYRNPDAMPRAYVVPRAEVAEKVAALRYMARYPAKEGVVMGAAPLPESGDRQSFTPASYHPLSPDHVVVKVRTESPGLLVVADTWMPGWKARLDGREVEILRGNLSQRVVPLLKPGSHRLEMRYDPPGLEAARWTAGLSLVLWLVWAGAGLFLGQAKASADQIQPWRLRSHHSRLSKVTKMRKKGQLSQRRTSF